MPAVLELPRGAQPRACLETEGSCKTDFHGDALKTAALPFLARLLLHVCCSAAPTPPNYSWTSPDDAGAAVVLLLGVAGSVLVVAAGTVGGVAAD